MSTPDDAADTVAVMEQLRQQVEALQQTLRQMSGGAVDAVMVPGAIEGDEELYTLTSADRPYRVIVESMGEGAATVSETGIIHYANQQFAAFLEVDLDGMVGRDLTEFVAEHQRDELTDLLRPGAGTRRAEITLHSPAGRSVPFLLAVTDMDLDGTLVRCLVLTDLTTQKAYETQLAERVAQTERQRVAQDVNDTIVQGLVAAEMALDLGQVERAREFVARTSDRARSWIGDLAGGEELRPGQAVRTHASDPGRASDWDTTEGGEQG